MKTAEAGSGGVSRTWNAAVGVGIATIGSLICSIMILNMPESAWSPEAVLSWRAGRILGVILGVLGIGGLIATPILWIRSRRQEKQARETRRQEQIRKEELAQANLRAKAALRIEVERFIREALSEMPVAGLYHELSIADLRRYTLDELAPWLIDINKPWRPPFTTKLLSPEFTPGRHCYVRRTAEDEFVCYWLEQGGEDAYGGTIMRAHDA